LSFALVFAAKPVKGNGCAGAVLKSRNCHRHSHHFKAGMLIGFDCGVLRVISQFENIRMSPGADL
jgi:hypothetical protein